MYRNSKVLFIGTHLLLYYGFLVTFSNSQILIVPTATGPVTFPTAAPSTLPPPTITPTSSIATLPTVPTLVTQPTAATTTIIPGGTTIPTLVFPKSEAQYVARVKCNFVVFGQFDYDQAKTACSLRGAALAFFTTPSEENAMRRFINWNLMPGFALGPRWFGQLWLGIKPWNNSLSGWAWDSVLVQNMQLPFTAWVNGDGTRLSPDYNCVIAREDGWLPFNCTGFVYGIKYPGGALCTAVTRTPPTDSKNNYCDTFLLPDNSPVAAALAFPVMIKKQYFMIRGSFTFDAASQACFAQSGGTLATARTADEFAFITRNVDFSLASNRAWLGLRRSNPGSTDFVWIDTKPIGFTGGFLPGEPSTTNGDCVAFDSANALLGWRVTPCGTLLSAVCEIFAFV